MTGVCFPACQRLLNFAPDIIFRVIKASVTFEGCGIPLRANKHDKNGGAVDCRLNVFPEFVAPFEPIPVPENILVSDILGKQTKKPFGDGRMICAAVTYKYTVTHASFL